MGYSSGGKHSNKNKDNALSEAVTMRLVGLNVYSTSYVPMDLKSEAEVTKVVNDLAVMNYCSNEAGLHWERQNEKRMAGARTFQMENFLLDSHSFPLDLERLAQPTLTQPMVYSLGMCQYNAGEQWLKYITDNP